MPLIQLHSSTNRSLPLISLFCQSVPKCRLPKNPASPRGKPRGRSHTLLPFIQPLSFVGCGRILSAPTVWVGKLLLFIEPHNCVRFGRLRASPTELRSFRFSLCTLPGGSGNQRVGTIPVRHCPAALPPASTASKCFADYQLLCELLILRLEIRVFYGYNSTYDFCNR